MIMMSPFLFSTISLLLLLLDRFRRFPCCVVLLSVSVFQSNYYTNGDTKEVNKEDAHHTKKGHCPHAISIAYLHGSQLVRKG